MRFQWSWALVALAVIPLVLAIRMLVLRRKRRYAVRYASLALVREARPGRSRWRRYVPLGLFLAALGALVLSLARPEVTVSVSRSRTTIMLALDVSRSMCSTDVEPNRLVVAQDAAVRFVDDQPRDARIGIVAFAGTSQVVVAPTADKERLRDAIRGLTTGIGTAIGNALVTSIDALSEVNPRIAPSTLEVDEPPFAHDRYQADIVVLLTDGANTRGIEPLVAAELAAERRLRVYTIGFGTLEPGPLVCTAEQLGGEAFDPNFSGGFGPGGPPPGFTQFLVIDEPTLEEIADTTGGEYFKAENAAQLIEVFRALPARVEVQQEPRELSVWFAASGAVLVLGGVGLALRWNRFP
jgi:Ca-activated chloride channel family protein